MNNNILGDFIHDEVYTDKIKRKEGNIYCGLIDTILSTTGEGITNILKTLPKFNIKRMEIEEIEKNLTRATEVVVYKLYQTDCGEYSLRNILDTGYNSTILDPIAANNIAYAVMSSVSKYMLASLLYYYDESFIFFYIRDYIVEKNFRSCLDKVREVYKKPTDEDILLRNAKEIKKYYNLLAATILTDATPNMNKFNEYIEIIKGYITTTKIDQLQDIIEMDVKYPVPNFLNEILTNNIKDLDKNRIEMADFLTKLNTTFTKEGLKSLFKQYGHGDMYDSNFETKLTTLYNDRLSNNGLTMPIDRLNIKENRILHKILTFDKLNDEECVEVKNNEILNNVNICLSKYLSVGTKCIIDNDKLIVISDGKSVEHNYLSVNIAKDTLSPFNVFGTNRDTMESIYTKEPEKFCANQTIITRKENSNAIMAGKSSVFNSSNEIAVHRKRNLNRLKQKYAKDKQLISEVNNLINGVFDKIKYVNMSWFKPIVMEDSKRSLLILAEMEGILNKIGMRSRSLDDKKQ